jgi:uncharacterized RDD family membrane protein YckC
VTQPSDEAAGRPPTGGPAPASGAPGSAGLRPHTPTAYGPLPGYGPPPQGYGPQGYGPQPGYPPGQQYAPPQYAPPPGYRPMPPPPLSPGGQPLADFGNRVLAYLIDVAIMVGVTMVVALPAFLLFFFTVMRDAIENTAPDGTVPGDVLGGFLLTVILIEFGLLVFVLAAYYVYEVEMMYKSGQTVGKRVMKLRVVPLDPALRLTRGMAAKRWLVQFVGGTILPFFSYLDGLWQLWDKPYLQTLHDKFAQTVVIKVSA